MEIEDGAPRRDEIPQLFQDPIGFVSEGRVVERRYSPLGNVGEKLEALLDGLRPA
jgi:hypothetical protein